jgi:hypothetical protein
MNAYWTFWLFIFLPVSFGLGEAHAIWRGRSTLSRYIWNLTAAWPPFGWLAGVITGFLACHFWWGGIGCFGR